MVEPIAHYPTPYGVKVPVFAHPEDPEDYVFDLDAAMTFAGVHGERDRRRCLSELKADLNRRGNTSTRFDVFLKNGGRVCPKVRVVRPASPAYEAMPRRFDLDIPIDAWVTAAMDQTNWFDRAVVLIDIVHGNIERQREWAVPEEIKALALSILLTATIEHLVETEIDCLEAAALYALTTHDEWSGAAIGWLKPFRSTWFRDWALDRPAYQEIARMMRKVNHDLPVWIVKGTSA